MQTQADIERAIQSTDAEIAFLKELIAQRIAPDGKYDPAGILSLANKLSDYERDLRVLNWVLGLDLLPS